MGTAWLYAGFPTLVDKGFGERFEELARLHPPGSSDVSKARRSTPYIYLMISCVRFVLRARVVYGGTAAAVCSAWCLPELRRHQQRANRATYKAHTAVTDMSGTYYS